MSLFWKISNILGHGQPWSGSSGCLFSVATYLSLSPENNTTIFSANRRNDAGETNKFIILLKNSSLGYRTTENSQHASASLIWKTLTLSSLIGFWEFGSNWNCTYSASLHHRDKILLFLHLSLIIFFPSSNKNPHTFLTIFLHKICTSENKKNTKLEYIILTIDILFFDKLV